MPVAFDQVAETPPRVARFIAHLITNHIPVWIACRSDQRKEIGHIWEHLYNFTRIEIPPLTPIETAALIQSAVVSGRIQADACQHSVELYRLSKGVPGTLKELLVELAGRDYKMGDSFGLNLLELDRQIHGLVKANSKLRR